jgi:hypothetical protein
MSLYSDRPGTVFAGDHEAERGLSVEEIGQYGLNRRSFNWVVSGIARIVSDCLLDWRFGDSLRLPRGAGRNFGTVGAYDLSPDRIPIPTPIPTPLPLPHK